MAYLLRTPKPSVFLRVPKTGSTWCVDLFAAAGLLDRELGRDHCLAQQIPSADVEGALKFAFVRHPLTWYASLWAFRKRFGLPRREVFRNATAQTWIGVVGPGPYTPSFFCDDFEWWLEQVVEAWPGWLSRMFGAFADEADFVGKTETIRADLRSVLMACGLDNSDVPDLVRTKVPENTALPEHARARRAPRNLLERVLEAESEACERFGYEGVPVDMIATD